MSHHSFLHHVGMWLAMHETIVPPTKMWWICRSSLTQMLQHLFRRCTSSGTACGIPSCRILGIIAWTRFGYPEVLCIDLHSSVGRRYPPASCCVRRQTKHVRRVSSFFWWRACHSYSLLYHFRTNIWFETWVLDMIKNTHVLDVYYESLLVNPKMTSVDMWPSDVRVWWWPLQG